MNGEKEREIRENDVVCHIPIGKRGVVKAIDPQKIDFTIGVKYDDKDQLAWYNANELVVVQVSEERESNYA